MLKINIRDIERIIGDKLYYRNTAGDVSFVDLRDCAEYHEKSVGTTEIGKVRCVGERMFAGPTAYYDLYSQDGIRLYLDLPRLNFFKRFLSKVFGMNFDTKFFSQYYSIQKSLNANGWTTCDLS